VSSTTTLSSWSASYTQWKSKSKLGN